MGPLQFFLSLENCASSAQALHGQRGICNARRKANAYYRPKGDPDRRTQSDNMLAIFGGDLIYNIPYPPCIRPFVSHLLRAIKMRIPLVIGFTFAIFPAIAIAEGWTSVHGVNSRGERVTWEYAEEAGQIDGRRFVLGSVSVEKKGNLLRTNSDEKCTFDIQVNGRWGFACSMDGKSPLAGTTYLYDSTIQRKTTSECSGTYYVCYRGCKRESPKHMYKEPWEC
jgi:hypothetical protein